MTSETLVDPVSQPIPISFADAPRLRDLKGLTLGLIDDSKPNAKELLDEIASLLEDRFETRVGMYHRKPSASKPADPAAVAEMAKECDYVIVAVGD